VETTYSSRSIDVLGKQHTLGLDDEEVDELVDVANQRVECFPRNSVVLAGTELGREAVVQEGLPGDLGSDGDAEDHPGELETPTHNIKVPNREDECDEGGIGDGRSTCKASAPALPAVPQDFQ
jgi:hypothetical protein